VIIVIVIVTVIW